MLDISAWKCCHCNYPLNPILDSNAAWFSSPRVRERCANLTHHYNIRGYSRQCPHNRCSTCIDLSIDGRMLRYCDGVMPVSGGAMPPRWNGHITVQNPGRLMGRQTRIQLQREVRRPRRRQEREERMEETEEMEEEHEMLNAPSMGNLTLEDRLAGLDEVQDAHDPPVDELEDHADRDGNVSPDRDVSSSSDTGEDDDAHIPALHLARQSLIVSLRLPSRAFSEQPQGETPEHANQGQHAQDGHQVHLGHEARGFQPVSEILRLPSQNSHQVTPRRQSHPQHVHQDPPIQQAQEASAPYPGTDPNVRGEQSSLESPEPPGTTREESERERELSPGGRF
ncbi:hypothetical protein BKA64DRAFT_647406 [Cadophora sp. MPI-SDFR-AT-0126]|nr:hypothetical protein BKA64DRAFT_647406 [Leotiomycetes sp. MPI-SDFR-AT-0126]